MIVIVFVVAGFAIIESIIEPAPDGKPLTGANNTSVDDADGGDTN